jgi:hypothetical protein
MQTLTHCNAKVMVSTRTAVGQFKGQFKGASAFDRGTLWKRGLGKSRRRAHIVRRVRIHVGVGQRCGAIDVKAPALPGGSEWAPPSIGSMDASSGRVQGASTQKQRCCHRCCSLQSEPLRWMQQKRHRPASRESEAKLHRVGAMNEMPQNVQNASTHGLRRQHAHSSRSVQGSVQGSAG